MERRTLASTSLLAGYLDWPDARQVFRVVRRRQIAGRVTEETAYGLTSLTPRQASAARLLELSRGHWAIENQLHHVRDVTFGEDACRVRKGTAPRLLAAIRNTAIALVRPHAKPSVAAILRRFAARPREALRLIQKPP